MADYLLLIPFFPFAGFLILSIAGQALSKKVAAVVGTGCMGFAALLTILVGAGFVTNPPDDHFIRETLWTWIETGTFTSSVSLYLDSLSLVFMLVITGVGFLIHLYSVEFMSGDEGFKRFFAYMNLFVAAMLILVMADNLVLMYLGWEGVGLCSYLLIGFWYKDPANGYAARKAFIVTRIGDTAMALGLFLLFTSFQTLDISEITTTAPATWSPGNRQAMWAALLLLGGAIGKSAQLPLQVWLPDAMAGPSPVSALIHAATMVTAGVYLIARMNVVFELAPEVMTVVAVIGAATLLIAGFSAMTQTDIKRVLAYSTISQIGYMFLALGLGAWSAAVFHFVTHAFFKALLFLGAGAVILAMHHEHDMFKMGGLWKRMPVVFWTFLAGSAALAALPLISAGFYSKDQILWHAWAGERGNTWFWMAGLLGAFITAIYTARMVIVTFFGKLKQQPDKALGMLIKVPLVVLAILSIFGGFVELPHTMGSVHLLSDLLRPVLPDMVIQSAFREDELFIQLLAAAIVLSGLFTGYVLYQRKPEFTHSLHRSFAMGHEFLRSGWKFDWLYDWLIVKPFVWLSTINKKDFVDRLYSAIVQVNVVLHSILSKTQTGQLRWYAIGIGVGALVIITIIAFK